LHRRKRVEGALALGLLLLLPCGARADAIAPSQAETLQQQLAAWLTGLLGPSIPLPDPPLRLTGEGDHYQATIPLPALSGDAAVTASLRPLDNGRWAIDQVKLPSAAKFTLALPEKGDAAIGGPTAVDMHIGKQDTNAVIDPSLTTVSTVQADVRDIAVISDNPKQHQEQRIDAYLAHSTLQPTANGKLDLDVEATMQGWRSASRMEGGTAVAIGAQQFRAVGQIGGASRERVTAAAAAATSLLATLPARIAEKGSSPELLPDERVQLRKLIAALDGMFQSVRLEETLDGLQVEVGGVGGVAIEHFRLALGGEAPEGKLHTWFDFGFDGLDTPNLPPEVTAYLPHHFAFRPSLSGLRTTDVSALALDATAETPDDKQLAIDAAAIFAHGGIDVGIETLAFDIGPAKVTGVGHLLMQATDAWHGEARVAATGLDALTEKVRSEPELQQALPFLMMLRGLARPDGDKLVWNIASDNGSLTVNGVDLSQLGGGKTKPKPLNQAPSR
jgi:hypothetical protein